jgi:uncharacterized membrane protein
LLDQLLLVLGAGLVLSRILFFFAYNWNALSRWSRFGIILVSPGWFHSWSDWKGLDTLGGQALLTASSVLLGIFLAVFGQVYQTGADAWTFFVGWGALVPTGEWARKDG